ncbi:hypothetical protein [Streptodolium elevatio]
MRSGPKEYVVAPLTKHPSDQVVRSARLDGIGQVTAVLASAGLTYGVIEGAAEGFAHPAVLLSLLVTLVASAGLPATAGRH